MKKILLTNEFTKKIEEILNPYLIGLGFSQQSIDHYRRYKTPYIHCIWLQERSDRKALCVNMGVHLDFLPVPGRLTSPPVNDVVEMECSIRVRLATQDGSDFWWPSYSPEKNVKSMQEVFRKNGIPFFERYTLFPGVFESITTKDILSGDALKIMPEKSWGGMAIFLARINEHIGRKDKAIQFSELGLELLKGANPRHTRPTKKELEDIIARCS